MFARGLGDGDGTRPKKDAFDVGGAYVDGEIVHSAILILAA
jgi:hypothetical protein